VIQEGDTTLRKRVLFVCIGNACRSQMAEGFAGAYGSDVMIAGSVGLAPATALARDTIRAMEEKNIDVREQFPKALRHLGKAEFDLVVNMSGEYLPAGFGTRIVDWEVMDPVLLSYKEHCEVRDEIERQVMKLILELRRAPAAKLRGIGSGRVEL
jgi:arsenate reductase